MNELDRLRDGLRAELRPYRGAVVDRLVDRGLVAAVGDVVRQLRSALDEVDQLRVMRQRVLALANQYDAWADLGEITYEAGELARVIRAAVDGESAVERPDADQLSVAEAWSVLREEAGLSEDPDAIYKAPEELWELARNRAATSLSVDRIDRAARALWPALGEERQGATEQTQRRTEVHR